MKQRITTSVGIILVLGIFFTLRFLEISTFDFLILGISLIGGYEVSNCHSQSGKNNFIFVVLFFVLANYLGLTICFAYNLKLIYPLLVMLALLVLSYILMLVICLISKQTLNEEYNLFIQNTQQEITYKKFIVGKINTTVKILLYPCVLLSSLYFLNNMSRFNFVALQNKADLGLFLLLLMFVISMSTDTMAFFTGKFFKGPKLAPKISPNKTISGAVGGLIFGMICPALLYLLFNLIPSYNELFSSINLEVIHLIMIGMMASIANQLGDLYESSIKRKLGVKDFGNIFPGHGGIMDRVDGLSFVALVLLILFTIPLI